jgi:hypothetical protein
MTLVRLMVLVLTLSGAASAADANGKWKLTLIGDPTPGPKWALDVVLDLKSDGKVLTGGANAGKVRGEAPITEGKIDGDQISFAFVGNRPWWSSGGPKGAASGYSRYTFKGTIEEDRMKVRLLVDAVMIYGDDEPASHEWDMVGERVR